MILHGIAGDEEAAGDVGGRMPRDHLAADVALARCQTVRREQQTIS